MYPLSSPDFFISFYLLSLKKWREKEQMDPIPYIEHSFLSIDRKIFVTDFALFFLGIPHIQGSLPQAPHPIRLVGGAVRLFFQRKS